MHFEAGGGVLRVSGYDGTVLGDGPDADVSFEHLTGPDGARVEGLAGDIPSFWGLGGGRPDLHVPRGRAAGGRASPRPRIVPRPSCAFERSSDRCWGACPCRRRPCSSGPSRIPCRRGTTSRRNCAPVSWPFQKAMAACRCRPRLDVILHESIICSFNTAKTCNFRCDFTRATVSLPVFLSSFTLSSYLSVSAPVLSAAVSTSLASPIPALSGVGDRRQHPFEPLHVERRVRPENGRVVGNAPAQIQVPRGHRVLGFLVREVEVV